ncbi:UTP--glucose-1-phosphate uridylyltransferase [subsurface metagenome]
MSKRAVILSGGKGTRLRPYTVVLPKPLMPLGEYSILEIVIRQLVKYGFTHITLAVNHQAELIKAFFGDGTKWNVKIDYSLEDKPLSTMGPLKLIQDLPDNFLVMNGDILTDLNFSSFYEDHVKQKSIFTISSYERTHIMEYGVLEINDEKELTGFSEKPSYHFHVSMGIYMLSKKVMDYIPGDMKFGFDDLMYSLIEKSLYPCVNNFTGYWKDIGRPDDYMQAIEDFEQMKDTLL